MEEYGWVHLVSNDWLVKWHDTYRVRIPDGYLGEVFPYIAIPCYSDGTSKVLQTRITGYFNKRNNSYVILDAIPGID